MPAVLSTVQGILEECETRCLAWAKGPLEGTEDEQDRLERT